MSAHVLSLVELRWKRYERAITDFNEWFVSEARCTIDYGDSVCRDVELLDALEQHRAALLDTPASCAKDVLYKIQLALWELDDVAGVDETVKLLQAAAADLKANRLIPARQVLAAALLAFPKDDDAAVARKAAKSALVDLRALMGGDKGKVAARRESGSEPDFGGFDDAA